MGYRLRPTAGVVGSAQGKCTRAGFRRHSHKRQPTYASVRRPGLGFGL